MTPDRSASGPTTTSNEVQAAYWTDVAGPHWVAQQRLFDTMLAGFSDRALQVFGAGAGERVVDIGCGTGTSSLALAEAVGATGSVVGFDISSTMIDAARSRAAGVAQLRYAVGDAQTDDLVGDGDGFDGVFSRFGVMFFSDPVAAFRNIGAAARSGARLTFACWQHEDLNEWIAAPARIMRAFTPEPVFPPAGAPGPFAFSDPQRIESILTASDWIGVAIEPCSAPTVMGAGDGLEPALMQTMGTTVGVNLRNQVDDDTFAAATDAVRSTLADHLVDGVVTFTGTVWIVTAHRP